MKSSAFSDVLLTALALFILQSESGTTGTADSDGKMLKSLTNRLGGPLGSPLSKYGVSVATAQQVEVEPVDAPRRPAPSVKGRRAFVQDARARAFHRAHSPLHRVSSPSERWQHSEQELVGRQDADVQLKGSFGETRPGVDEAVAESDAAAVSGQKVQQRPPERQAPVG